MKETYNNNMKTLRDAVATVLDGIKGTAGFNAVYYEMPTKVLITPAVALLMDGGEEQFETTGCDSLILELTIRTMVEKQDSTDNDKTATDTLLTINDAILAEFRKKSTMTLSGESYFLLAGKIEKILIGSIENLNVFFQDITITVKTIKDIVA